MGGSLLVILLMASVLNAFEGKPSEISYQGTSPSGATSCGGAQAQQTQQEPAKIAATQATPSTAQEATPTNLVDGMQVVNLGWGVLNYKPDVITVKAGTPVRIKADMTRLRGCYRSFIIRGMGVVGQFTNSKPYIDFFPEKPGKYTFSCSMNMARGTLIVT